MKIELYSIDRTPSTLPIWQLIRDDLGRPSAPRIAKALGISVRSVHRYNSAGSAPRVVCLALFWLTRWGHSQINAQAVNDAALAVGAARCLGDELREVRLQLLELESRSGIRLLPSHQPLLGASRA